MPRVICAALAGANLALSGCILQGILRNPLADPGIIGISAGAGLAAMALMMLAPSLTALVPLAAFAGALGAAAVVFLLAWERGVNPLRLVLAGVAVAAFFGGGMTALSVFFSDKVQGTVSWLAGGFAGASWQSVRMIVPYSVIGIIGTLCLYRRLNALQLGDDVARTLGVRVDRTRTMLIALAALLAASAVSVAGLLGFVGLIVPHVMRLVVGSDFEPLLPCSALFGAILVAGADIAARTLFSPMEVPVGIFMSFIGAPFFLYLLKRRMRAA
jgi:iron complex transport system permease protein